VAQSPPMAPLTSLNLLRKAILTVAEHVQAMEGVMVQEVMLVAMAVPPTTIGSPNLPN